MAGGGYCFCFQKSSKQGCTKGEWRERAVGDDTHERELDDLI